jgi:hypothetical protein
MDGGEEILLSATGPRLAPDYGSEWDHEGTLLSVA